MKIVINMYNTKLSYIDIAEVFIQRFGINKPGVNIKDSDRLTPLMYAAIYDTVRDLLILIIQAGANVNDEDIFGYNALLYARAEKNIIEEKILKQASAK